MGLVVLRSLYAAHYEDSKKKIMTEFEWLASALKGCISGVVGYLAHRILRSSEDRLESLRTLPCEEMNGDLEEVLGHFVEQNRDKMVDASGVTISEGCKVIGSGVDAHLAYFRLRVVQIPAIALRDEKEEG